MALLPALFARTVWANGQPWDVAVARKPEQKAALSQAPVFAEHRSFAWVAEKGPRGGQRCRDDQTGQVRYGVCPGERGKGKDAAGGGAKKPPKATKPDTGPARAEALSLAQQLGASRDATPEQVARLEAALPSLTLAELNRVKTSLGVKGGKLKAEVLARVQGQTRKLHAVASAALAARGKDAPAFKQWAAGTKVAGPDGQPEETHHLDVISVNGKPVVLYHGSTQDFTKFDKAKMGNPESLLSGPGFYFTEDRGVAESYAKGPAGKVHTVYLAISNPFNEETGDGILPDALPPVWKDRAAGRKPRYGTPGYTYGDLAEIGGSRAAATKLLQDLGYDGMRSEHRGAPMWIAFEPEQIITVPAGPGKHAEQRSGGNTPFAEHRSFAWVAEKGPRGGQRCRDDQTGRVRYGPCPGERGKGKDAAGGGKKPPTKAELARQVREKARAEREAKKKAAAKAKAKAAAAKVKEAEKAKAARTQAAQTIRDIVGGKVKPTAAAVKKAGAALLTMTAAELRQLKGEVGAKGGGAAKAELVRVITERAKGAVKKPAAPSPVPKPKAAQPSAAGKTPTVAELSRPHHDNPLLRAMVSEEPDFATSGAAVGIGDIRKALPGVPREQLHAALNKLIEAGVLNPIRNNFPDNPEQLANIGLTKADLVADGRGNYFQRFSLRTQEPQGEALAKALQAQQARRRAEP